MRKVGNKPRAIKLLILLIILITCFSIWQNNDIVVSSYQITSDKITKEIDGFRIVQVSDLHNKDFGNRLIGHIKKLNPNIILVTGDIIDRRSKDIDTAVEFLYEAVNIAPVFYVTGNHEASSPFYEELQNAMESLHVFQLDDASFEYNYNGEKIQLLGLRDPAFSFDLMYSNSDSGNSVLKEKILQQKKETAFNILLSHRPELFHIYQETEVDLVFSGHAHGGQVRLPFIGGIVAPNQGFFPKYTSGTHSNGDTTLVISRGLGNSIIPVRVFNRPEVVCVTLKMNENLN